MAFDAYRRTIDYLRISVTDRCNLRCVYCMPEEGVPTSSHDEILRYEEIELVVRAAVTLGIHSFRLTGGEPLVRLGLVELVRILATIPGVDDLAMTTNGMLLARYADDLVKAGLGRVNVSLDTLRPGRFHEITRWGELSEVLAGIEAAREAGLSPVKINTVVMRGVNDDEVVDLARKTIDSGWHVRFIEWMPVGAAAQDQDWRARVVTAQETQAAVVAVLGPLTPVAGPRGAGPARAYRLPGATGSVGFITPVSDHFCGSCNRLRLTATGQLRPCLLADAEIDLREPLRNGADIETIRALLLEAVHAKPGGHRIQAHEADPLRDVARSRSMSQIGG